MHWFENDLEEANKRRKFFTRLFHTNFFSELVEVDRLKFGDVFV